MNEKNIKSTNATVANALAATVANASIFKKGEKVMSRMYGTRGIIQEVYGDDWYAVQYEGEKFPTKIQGYKLSHLPNIPNAAPAVKNARVTSVRDFNDLLNGIEEDIENPGWGWDKRAERKLLDELKPFAMQYGKMSDWQRVDSLLRRAANSTAPTAKNAEVVGNVRIVSEKWFPMAHVVKYDNGRIGWSARVGSAKEYDTSDNKNTLISSAKKLIEEHKKMAEDLERAVAYIQTL